MLLPSLSHEPKPALNVLKTHPLSCSSLDRCVATSVVPIRPWPTTAHKQYARREGLLSFSLSPSLSLSLSVSLSRMLARLLAWDGDGVPWPEGLPPRSATVRTRGPFGVETYTRLYTVVVELTSNCRNTY